MICQASNDWGRLNAFQKLMLHWSELHPYNAIHAFKLVGPLRADDLRNAVQETFIREGIGEAEVSLDGRLFRHTTDFEPTIQTTRCNPHELEETLASQITSEVNYQFGRPSCKPFRFLAVETGENSHHVLLSYDHWVADSTAARLLARRVLGRYLSLQIPENDATLDLYPRTYRDQFPSRLGGWRVIPTAVRSMSAWLTNRCGRQVANSVSSQRTVGFELLRTAPGTVEKLREYSHSLGVTVHDVILAAASRSLDAHLPCKASQKKRDMGLGTIVDLRGDAADELNESLGAFLSYYAVGRKRKSGEDLRKATQEIAAATRKIKRQRSYLGSLFTVQLSNIIWSRLNEDSRQFYMRNTLPLTAGVSNVYLRTSWINKYGKDLVLDYFRGVSTGPAMPLTLTPTTLNNRLSIGASYRLTAFTQAKINAVLGDFMEQIENPQAGEMSGKALHAESAPAALATTRQ